MSKRKVTRKEKQQAAANKYVAQPVAAAASPKRAKVKTKTETSGPVRELTYGPEFYKWMGGGFVLMLIGMLLMTGGEMPDPNTWDEGIIYSFRRITLAPIVIMTGLGVVTYAIFKK